MYKPGEVAPKSATYNKKEGSKIVGTVDVKKGDKFPPSQKSGVTYSL